jgi:hypothetical protein
MQTFTILLVITGYISGAVVIGTILGKRLKKVSARIPPQMSASVSDFSGTRPRAIIRQFPRKDLARPVQGRK